MKPKFYRQCKPGKFGGIGWEIWNRGNWEIKINILRAQIDLWYLSRKNK